jgi:dsDNA-specific endonuclease/ATPase MutS2
MKTEDILAFQLQVFEQRLDEAIVAGASEVVFIHGVGNGVLRNEVQKRLSKHPHVEYFKDAKKEKFGYGATLAKIK